MVCFPHPQPHSEAFDVRPWALETSVFFDVWLDNMLFIHTCELAVFSLSICNPFHYKRHLMCVARVFNVCCCVARGDYECTFFRCTLSLHENVQKLLLIFS